MPILFGLIAALVTIHVNGPASGSMTKQGFFLPDYVLAGGLTAVIVVMLCIHFYLPIRRWVEAK